MEQRVIVSPTQAELKESDLAKTVSKVSKHNDYRLFGLAIFLIADGMTFAGFFAAYLTFRAVNPLPPGAVYELEMPLPILNTVLLLLSSTTFHRANHWLQRGETARCRRLLMLTSLLGLVFLASQMTEYFSLPFGLTENIYASTFYVVTGFHGLHVTLGVIMIMIVWWQARAEDGRVARGDHFPVEAAELYWHFVDGIWVILFVILYLV